MNQQERCLWLIKALLKDMPQYADTPIPISPDHRWRLLRSLMNVRPPMPTSEEFLQIIKYNFWQQVYRNEDAVYACLNMEDSPVPDEIRDRSIVISSDSSQVIQELVS